MRSSSGPWRDLGIVIISVLGALLLVRTGLISAALSLSSGTVVVGAFIAGILFTSVLTAPLALAAFAEMAHSGSLVTLSLSAAVGSVLADIGLFLFIKIRLKKVVVLAVGRLHHSRLARFFKYRTARLILPLVGAFAIASPLPDEVGLALLGITKARLWVVAILSFVLHFVGTLVVLLALRTIA